MKWNHRLMNCPSENGGEDYFTFKEVYYDDQDRPESYSDPFMGGDDIDEVRRLVARLADCIDSPVLHEKEFEGELVEDIQRLSFEGEESLIQDEEDLTEDEIKGKEKMND